MQQSIFFFSLFALMSCGKGSNKDKPNTDSTGTDTSKTTTTQHSPLPYSNETVCFEKKDKNSKEKLEMTTLVQISMDDNKVTGTYDEERLIDGENTDAASGDLTGTRKGDTLFLTLKYTIEGYEAIEETIWLLGKDQLSQKRGELIEDKNGHMVLKDASKATFDEVYNKVRCK